MIKEIGTIPTTGIGAPDYTEEVSAGQIRPGISLKDNQRLLIFGFTAAIPDIVLFSGYHTVVNVIAPGASQHVIDFNTGIAMPFYVPAGFALTFVELNVGSNQDVELWLYFDTQLAALGISSGSGIPFHGSNILGYSTLMVDPKASSPHLIDIVAINRGLANLRGGVQIVTLFESIGTPPFPTDKDTMCSFCGAINKVPIHATVIICSKCGKTYLVYDTTSIRSSR